MDDKQDNDDESVGDTWRAVRAASQVKRETNRKSSADLLRSAGVKFISKNNAAHLIVNADRGQIVDFWPGTGLWIMRGSTQRHGGVKKLIAFCKLAQPGSPTRVAL